MMMAPFIARITPKGERLFYFRYTDSKGARVRLPIQCKNHDGMNTIIFSFNNYELLNLNYLEAP